MIEFFVRGPIQYRDAYREFEPDVVYDNPSPFPFHPAHIYGDAPVVNKVHGIYRSLAFACKDHPIVKLGTIAGEESYRLFRGEYFITNSQSTAERLQTLIDTGANKLVANPIGINASEFDFHIPSNSKQVFSVSKLSPRKRVSDLLRAWEFVQQHHPEASLIIAGSGPLTEELQALKREIGLKNVCFTGFVSETEKKQYLRESAVFASPTLYEGFGLSNLEAMASGCVVVSSNTWGVKDYLDNGEGGVSVPPKSPRKLGKKLCEVLANPTVRTQLAQNGRDTANEYSMSESLNRELKHLHSIAEDGTLHSSI